MIVHDHNPDWREKSKVLRNHRGDLNSSHLSLQDGNYFGAWQHFDVVNVINSEYCLQLDADTIVMHPFTLVDFGLNMTFGIAMSADVEPQDIPFQNAGVTLINIPQMRRSYKKFLELVQRHTPGTVLRHEPPSDYREAVFDFFSTDIRFLEASFNCKPYWYANRHDHQNPFIVHFHRPKPHHFIGHIHDGRIQFVEPIWLRCRMLV